MRIISFIMNSVLEYSDAEVSYYWHESGRIIRVEWYDGEYICEIVPYVGY